MKRKSTNTHDRYANQETNYKKKSGKKLAKEPEIRRTGREIKLQFGEQKGDKLNRPF